MIIRAKAPLRVSFGGGGTDVSPYPEERGGVVLSTTIDKYAYGTLIPRTVKSIEVKSLDYDIIAKYDVDSKFQYDGKLDLVKATIKVMQVKDGMDLFLHSDAPPGSGLGTSSTLTVALIGLFSRAAAKPITDYEVAELAYHIERDEAGIKGGRQDQYAATFGGFNFIEFFDKVTIVNPLRINEETLNELQYRLMLCYIGKTRISAGIIDKQVNAYIQKEDEVIRALDNTKEIAIQMKNDLLRGHLDEFGSLLHEGWCNKKKFSSAITDPQIDELYEAARDKGAIGGKLLGAGGGGYFLLFCQFDKRHKVAEELERLGGKIVNFAFEPRGLRSWVVNSNR